MIGVGIGYPIGIPSRGANRGGAIRVRHRGGANPPSRPVPTLSMDHLIHEPSPSARAEDNEHLTARGGRPWMKSSNEEVTTCPE